MKTIAVIPAYNEETRIADAVRDAARFVDAIVVVDDCSHDHTGECRNVGGCACASAYHQPWAGCGAANRYRLRNRKVGRDDCGALRRGWTNVW